MSIQRFSSRRKRLYDSFLSQRLKNAASYDRIAGYFQSSLLALAADEFKTIPHVRIVCNTDVNPADVHAVRQSLGPRREELEQSLLRMVWNEGEFPHLVDVYGEQAKERLRILQELVTLDPDSGRSFEIRIVPDCEFGFVHGKAGVIRYQDGTATSFMGSANDSQRAWSQNYELVWEDPSAESIEWVQEEFDALWERGFPISQYIVRQIGRLGSRTIIEHIGDWRKSPAVEKVLAEVPTCTELFGFWEHQKYFIKMAFDEHRLYEDLPGRGARYLLADGVGLGKTLQLGGLAKLIGTLSDEPILIVAPKAVVAQWQEEIYDKLAAPSAVWTGKGWLTERGEFHPATEESVTKCPRKIAIVSTSVVLSATRSVMNGRLAEELLKKRFSCVLWDEAHKIRRENVREPKVWGPPKKNLLYEWAMKLAARCRTMILATATPVQLHPIELWDLLNVLAVNNDQVLGTAYGRWSHCDAAAKTNFEILAGRESVDDAVEKWSYWKDPLPRERHHDVFRMVRATLNVAETSDVAVNADIDRIDPLDREELDWIDVRELNPFTMRVIKRSRDRLEKDGKLVRIELIPVDDDQPVTATHSIREALDLAERFAKELHKKNTAGGFIKTLLQRRVGSSVIAGLKTAQRMLEQEEIEDEEGANERSPSLSDAGIYPLTPEERELLGLLRDHLKRQVDHDGDPKFDRVLDTLESRFDDQTWLERGVLIFSQFYDSAYALCEFLAQHLDLAIGLYANSSSSKLFENGKIQTIDRELLKEKVRVGTLKILVGTDAASTGLNLQTLGSLINLDLPWNPTTLEQRKGRVQRGTVAKQIPYCNLRYNEGVEARLFNVLTGRIKEITDIFGTIPDFITDEWVDALAEDRRMSEDDLVKMVTGKSQSPFNVKESYEYLDDEWEGTAEVLNSKEAIGVFLEGW
ncbi:SNF2-related protein [Stieleria sp. TO1_6]|uniref:helicase-related protein n=1 Tax=Stieleria tagensis TaxID=2956795 RepID=UPI00209A901E|nr:helicase-related protein [Stieleria tagensis]MCO8122598.1 SNF2-related protein [Stieleria tagensis]